MLHLTARLQRQQQQQRLTREKKKSPILNAPKKE